jgi:hypothetical protein
MNKYWFEPKTYGYGYVPISTEGWIATFIVIILALGLAYLNNFFNPIKLNFLNSILFLLEIVTLSFAFLKLFEKRCKGKLSWKWGN